MPIRDATPSDFLAILDLNEASVSVLSALTSERLAVLARDAAHHRVIDIDGEVTAFLLAFREDSRYDGLNFRWFQARFDKFIYVDRVVVGSAWQRRGFGPSLYADLFARAGRSQVERIACEFDIDPPNDASRRFHVRHGFHEVGVRTTATGKRVSMQLRTL